ncbi:MAG: hypothetical protein ABI877_00160 [Gemmatimonadaceae bacterium]
MRARHEILDQQQRLIDRYDEAAATLRAIPGVLSVGVGARERRGELVPELAFRVYVAAKIDEALLPDSYRVPRTIFGLPTDVIIQPDVDDIASSSSSGPFVPNRDGTEYRPLKGGSQLRNEKFQDDDNRGLGTIGCLARTSDGQIVALTSQHVACAGTEFNVVPSTGSSSSSSGAPTTFSCAGVKVGQPRHVICCCCCTRHEIGAVLRTQKNAQVDCAIVQLDSETTQGVTSGNTLNEVVDIGALTGVAQAVCFSEVRKRGAATRLTRGTVVDVLYEGSQILINPLPGSPKFAFYGDSGSVIVNSEGKVVGLLWGADRGTKNRGVANHIGPVLVAMGITIAGDAGTGLGIPSTSCGSSSSSGTAIEETPSSSSAVSASSSSLRSSSSSSKSSLSSSSSCGPRITGGPRWYSGVTKDVARLIGCKAKIDTFQMRVACEGTATYNAFTTVWTGITKADVSKWGQIGITRRRTSGVAAVVQYIKCEVKAGPSAADYHLEQAPGFPANGTTQEYECVLDPATGNWEFFVAGVSKFNFKRPGWVNDTGDRVDYNAEIFDLGSQMPGTAANKCHITGCQLKFGTPTSSSSSSSLAVGAYVPAGLVAANVTVSDNTEHGCDLVSATAIDIWDIKP